MIVFNILKTSFWLLLVYLTVDKWLLPKIVDFFSDNTKKNSKLSNNVCFEPPNPVTPQPPSYSVLHEFQKAAVCSDSLKCSQIGTKTLEAGGSAVDAAISTLLCNGLITMQSMGIGGGMLMNIYSRKDNRAYSVLAREVAPLAFDPQFYEEFKNGTEMARSSLSIAVPTELMGYAVAHERFGKLPWRELAQPTVEICNAGFLLTQHQRDALDTNWFMVSKDPMLRQMFVDSSTNVLLRVGSLIKPSSELCRTYEMIAKDGPRSFYNGDLAKNIVKDLSDMGSLISAEDFNNLSVNITESKALRLGAYQLHLMPPPSSGYIVGLIMQILSNFKTSSMTLKATDALSFHRVVEAFKFAFVKRWELDMKTDSDFLERLTCPKYAENLVKLINDTTTYSDLSYYGAPADLVAQSEFGTAQISIVVPNGDAVSVTSSINFYFGSGRTGTRTGVLFNNAMCDFNMKNLKNYFDLPNWGLKNQPTPGVSPMSSMSPIIVTNLGGIVRLVVGAAGGTKIISVLTQVLVRVLWLGESIKSAIDAARFHHQLLPNVFEYEYGVQQQIIDALEAKRHKTKMYRVRGSAVYGVEQKKGIIKANADYRKEGGVDGF